MATKYWVGGNGNWSSLTNWRTTSGGAVVTTAPGSADAAVLDANSSTSVVTVDSSVTVQTLTCTGFTGTLAFGTNTISLNSTGTIFTGATTMTITGTPLIICTNSSATARTITPTAVTEANSISFRITAGTGTFTITNNQSVRDLDFTDGTNPTGFGGSVPSSNTTVYGNFKASTGMSFTGGTGTYTFAATSGTKTITSAGLTIDRPFTFNGIGGTWQLQDALTSGSTRTLTLTSGTLNLSSYTLTTGNFSSNNSNIRTLAFGTGKIVLAANNGSTFAGATSTGASVTGTSPLVQFTYSGGTGTRNIIMWSLPEAQSISVEFLNNATDTVSIQGVTAGYRNIDFTNFNGTIVTANTPRCFGNFTLGSSVLSASGTSNITFASTSGTKTITNNGKTINFPITFDGIGGTWAFQDALTMGSTATSIMTITNGTVQLKASTTNTIIGLVTSGTNQKFLLSTTSGTQATISQSSGTVSVSYLTIQDSNATGGAAWDANASTNVDAGNNTGWFFAPTPSVSNEVTMRLRSFTQPRRF